MRLCVCKFDQLFSVLISGRDLGKLSGTALGYRLDYRGFKSRLGAENYFPHHRVQTGSGDHPAYGY
jgi:hypothetical protein